MSEDDIKKLEKKINNLASQIYELNEPLDWDDIRTNVFPSKTARENGIVPKKLSDYVSKDWHELFWRIFNVASKWSLKFRNTNIIIEEVTKIGENVYPKYTDALIQALTYSLVKYVPENGEFMHLFSVAFKGYTINQIKEEEGDLTLSFEYKYDEDTQSIENKTEDSHNYEDDILDNYDKHRAVDILLNNMNKIYMHRNNKSDSSINTKSIVYTHKIFNDYLLHFSEDDLRKCIAKYDFLKPASEAILYYYQSDKEKINLKEFCKYLEVSYDAVFKQKQRLEEDPLFTKGINSEDL